MAPINRFRQLEAALGYLIAPTGLRIPIKNLSITTDSLWWGGRVWLLRGETIEPGTFRLTMNDGRTADLSIDEIHVNYLGFTRAAFHGFGPAP